MVWIFSHLKSCLYAFWFKRIIHINRMCGNLRKKRIVYLDIFQSEYSMHIFGLYSSIHNGHIPHKNQNMIFQPDPISDTESTMHGMREPGMYKIQELDYWLLKTSNGRLSCTHPLNEILAKTKMRRQRCKRSVYSICSRWSSSRMRWIYK